MSTTGHLNALKAKHEDLDTQIQSELQRPLPDTVAIQAMKRRKLRIKEQVTASA